MAQLEGVERENRQAEELIAWQSAPTRQQVRLPTYSVKSRETWYLGGLRIGEFHKFKIWYLELLGRTTQ